MWSRRSTEVLLTGLLLAAVAGCAGTPQRAQPTPAAAAATPAPPAPPPIPAAAQAAFAQALALAHAGNDAVAEAQLAGLARQYPQFHTPLVDLGILYRGNGDLEAASHALREALARDPRSAAAWTELGVTQRLGGKFQDAAKSYARAIGADPRYAPAYRDRGVLRDLYLDQPAAALEDFRRYRQLTGKEQPVAMWIAELEHRTGARPPAIPGGGRPPHPDILSGRSPPGPARPPARN